MSFYEMETAIRSRFLESWVDGAAVGGTDVSAVASPTSFYATSTDLTPLVDQWVLASGFTSALNSGLFKVGSALVTGVPGATQVAVTGVLADESAGAAVEVQPLASPVSWPNQTFKGPLDHEEPWVSLHIDGEESEVACWVGGERRYRSFGSVRLEVNAPLGEGDGEADLLCERFADEFRHLRLGSLYFTSPSQALDGQDRGDGFFRKAVAVPFRYDYTP